MDLNEKKRTEIYIDKINTKNDLIEINNKMHQINIINNININQSNGSIKTTEYSSESGELISKYISDNLKNNLKINNNQKLFKENKNNNIQFNNNIQKEICKISKGLYNKNNNKAPKLVEYKSEYLTKNNRNINAPKIPINYDIDFNLDNYTNQDNIGEEEYITKTKNNKYNKNEEFKSITKIPHEHLSHLCLKENLNINNNVNNYNTLSVTQRIKHKFLTIVYISPKK